jgi:RNA polymerase sigma-70 factor (ECF subfamily)
MTGNEFDELVRQTRPGLLRFATRLLADACEAQDVLQESYIKAYDAIARGDYDGRASYRTWLYSIVRNAAYDALRRRRRRSEAPEPPVVDERFDERVVARARLGQVAMAIDELPPNQRNVLLRRSIEGRSTREVAGEMSCSLGAVEQRLVRARAQLRRSMTRLEAVAA